MVPLGTLYIIAAASGTGKTSLAKALAEALPKVTISVSHTTRQQRFGEVADQHYFFVDTAVFEAMIDAGQFLEHAKVFGHYYGTSACWVREQLQQGNDVILDIDWQGAEQIRNSMPCVSIFLLPPSLHALRLRLEARKRESPAMIEQRLTQAQQEIAHYQEFDYLVINDDFQQAVADLMTIFQAQRLRTSYQVAKQAKFLQELR